MKRFEWQHIQFASGGNPYICTSEKEFKRIQSKYDLKQIKDGFYIAYEKED